jgi:hypothetical protein
VISAFFFASIMPTTSFFIHYVTSIFVSLYILRYRIFLVSQTVLFSSVLLLLCSIYIGDPNPLRYIIFPIGITLGYKCCKRTLKNLMMSALVMNFLWVLFEVAYPSSGLRLFFRSSLVEYHIDRSSGLFSYPGDLGHFCVMALMAIMYLYQEKELSLKTTVIAVVATLFMLFESQSRMAFVQFFSCLLFSSLAFRVSKTLIFALIILFMSAFYLLDLKYLLNINVKDLFNGLIALDGEKFKRFADIRLLSSAGILPMPVPKGVDFIEVGFVRQSFNVGIVLAIIFNIYLLSMLSIKFVNLRKSNGVYIIILASTLIIFNFIGAPLDRPKLNLFSLFFIGYALSPHLNRGSHG